MTIERGEAGHLFSELLRLLKTRDYQQFLQSLNYHQKMKEFNKQFDTPEFKEMVEGWKETFLTPPSGITPLADQDGHVHLLRNGPEWRKRKPKKRVRVGR